MIFTPAPIPGAWIVAPEPLNDARGFFARIVCQQAFAERGLNANFVQQSISFNNARGILRGMHFQAMPHGEEKLVRVTTGSIWDVILDLRPASPTYRQWFSVELSAANHLALYIPKGVAHGFQTLSDTTEVVYQMTEFYTPDAERGILWSDDTIGITWPITDPIVSTRDQSHPTWVNLFGGHHDSSL